MPSEAKQRTWRRLGIAAWLLLSVGLFALHLYPIRFGSLRLCLAMGVLLWWIGALGLAWSIKSLRWGSLALSALGLALLLLPGRASDRTALRAAYVSQLQSYSGAPYVWGGESQRGIDCSGLMRCPLIDANLRRGVVTLNPALVRESLALWWRDASALELKDGYANRTRPLFAARALKTLTPTQLAQLQPGDMAVTASGGHVLAYLGHQTWIEADHSLINGDSVIQVKLPSKIGCFNTSVRLVRWRQLG